MEQLNLLSLMREEVRQLYRVLARAGLEPGCRYLLVHRFELFLRA